MEGMMPRGPNGEKRPADVNAAAVMVARIATGEIEDERYRAPGGRRSGVAGAQARNEALSEEQRRAVASGAARKRWA
jgi:hypothetical protein